MNTPDYEIRLATKEDALEITELMLNGFYKDEPLIKYIREKYRFPEDAVWKIFSEAELLDPSLVVVKDGKIIGVSLNKIFEKGKDNPPTPGDDKSQARIVISDFLDYADEQSNFWNFFPDCQKGIAVGKVSIIDDYKGKGIATRLINKIREIGKERRYGFIKVLATSHYTALALEKLGFQLIYTLEYKDYKVDGEVVFEPEPPHEAIKVYVQGL